MIKSIIHAGGESTRLKNVFDGPKALAPIDDYPLLWFHLQPLIKSGLVDEYIFTLRDNHEKVLEYISLLEEKFNIKTKSIIEPKPLGRAGVMKLGLEQEVIDVNSSYIISHPDDLIPINLHDLLDYAEKAEEMGKCAIMIMARQATSPFGVGVVEKSGGIVRLKDFMEKPEIPLIDNHYINTGMSLFLPEAMKEIENVSSNEFSNLEDNLIPKLVDENKVAVFLINRWISINHSSEYKKAMKMGKENILEFLNV